MQCAALAVSARYFGQLVVSTEQPTSRLGMGQKGGGLSLAKAIIYLIRNLVLGILFIGR
jgi:hypothetical protein